MLSSIWSDLERHQQEIAGIHLRDLFQADLGRFSKFSIRLDDLLLDYSKHRVTAETLKKLEKLAEEANLSVHIEALFSGEAVNRSERRAALHTVLRDSTPEPFLLSDRNIKADIHRVLDKMETFVENCRTGKHLGASGERIQHVISLGIGGSELGPRMALEALRAYKSTDIKIHFISNVDGLSLASLLNELPPTKTLCLINSKTFTTPETLQNARSVYAWLKKDLGEKLAFSHLVGVTANRVAAERFGILPDNIFEFWDFVGGRYSIWSSVGLPLALAIGMGQFRAFLKGAHGMDEHFRTAPFLENMPVLLGLLGIWNHNFWQCQTQAVIPYDDGLKRLPDYLQQLEMESNGKRVKQDGSVVTHQTAPIIWGGVGCNGQHAYMQLLHQGTQVIPVDFLLPAEGHADYPEQHQLLVASCLSQSKALMEGNREESTLNVNEPEPLTEAKQCLGDRPSSTLMYPKLTPAILGALIALYEHKVFVQGVLWEINSFDQWGVELGKNLVNKILPYLRDAGTVSALDSSTEGLIHYVQKHQSKSLLT
jgi:glucose-6-phosphate isomerase